jgi:hypothetical protein
MTGKPGWKSFCKVFWFSVDYLALPLAIFFLLYSPNYADGVLLHAEAGQHLGGINDIMHGMVPFRDTFSLYGPINDFLPYLAMKIFGTTFQVLRAYFHYTTIIGLIIGYFLARNVLKTRVFVWMASLVLMIETFDPFWSSRWGGIRSGSGLLILLLLIKSYDSEKWKNWLSAAGVTSALALLNSMEIGILGAFTAVVYAMLRSLTEGGGIKKSTRYLYPFLTGFAAILLPFALFYLTTSALTGYVRWTFFEFPLGHMSNVARGYVPPPIPPGFTVAENRTIEVIRWILSYRLKSYLPALVYFTTAIFLLISLARKSAAKRETVVLATLAAYGIPLYLAAFRGIDGPQFSSSIAPAILISLVFVEHFALNVAKTMSDASWRTAPGFAKLTIFICFLVLGLIYAAFSPTDRSFGSGIQWVNSEISKYKNYNLKDPSLVRLNLERAGNVYLPKEQAYNVQGVVTYILSHTAPEEPIFAFPEMGSYYFLTGRPNFTKFPVANLACINEKYRQGLINDVRQHAPRYVIFDMSPSAVASATGKSQDGFFPELNSYFMDNYYIEATFDTTLILRHK